MNTISDNTKAILLLTAPLIVSQKAEPSKTLSLREYNLLARSLQSMNLQPSDLLGSEVASILPKLPTALDPMNLKVLLERGIVLGQALAEWHRRSIWVVSRADPSYPKRLKARLRELAPPILYGCGNRSLLESGGLAVVGSRNVSDALRTYTMSLGALAAKAQLAIISGAARGIDSAAMTGALEQGGRVIGVMADSLGRAALAKSNRQPLQQGRLVLISFYDPAAGFNVGHAMQRNKAIYALADASLVASVDFNKGGTWAGAIEQLEKFHYVPVFVRHGQEAGEGALSLIQRGGRLWSEPQTATELIALIQSAVPDHPKEAKQTELSLAISEPSPTYPVETASLQDKGQKEPQTTFLSPAKRLN